MPTAMSLGHVQVFGTGHCRCRNGRFLPNGSGILVVDEENSHTRQAEILGPLHLPLHALAMISSKLTGGGTHDNNLLEIGPRRGRGPWSWN